MYQTYQCFVITHKWFRLKVSNANFTLKNSLIISDIDGIKHLLQKIHGLHHKIEHRENIV